MKRSLALALPALLLCLLLAGCTGIVVARTDGDMTEVPQSASVGRGDAPLRTGLYIGGSVSDSHGAAGDDAGEAAFEVHMAAVLVDDAGVIQSCVLDGVSAKVNFDGEGKIISNIDQTVYSKNELGEAYGMKRYAASRYEWNEQAAALARYAVGKTAAELRSGAINENGYAADIDIASMATIYLGDYVSAIESAVQNARELGAQAGDTLKLVSLQSLDESHAAQADAPGAAVLNGDAAAITFREGVISSCMIDSLQASVAFDAQGVICSDTQASLRSKNAQGEAYGMKQYAGSSYEWNEQAAAFAQYVVGKTAAQVQEIKVDARTAPMEIDLASSVTIAIGNFQALIAKAAQ